MQQLPNMPVTFYRIYTMKHSVWSVQDYRRSMRTNSEVCVIHVMTIKTALMSPPKLKMGTK